MELKRDQREYRGELSLEEKSRRLVQEFGVRAEEMWEPALAIETAQALLEEEKGLEGEQLRALMQRRWIDAFYPSTGRSSGSELSEKFVLEPARANKLAERLMRDRTRVDSTSESTTKDDERRLSMGIDRENFDVRTYGVDVLADVASSGVWAKVSSQDVRVLGSSKFSCCSAIAGVSNKGELCFAHVPGPHFGALAADGGAIIKEKFGDGKYVVVTPERKFVDGADERNVHFAELANQQAKQVAEDLGLPHFSYTEMFPDKESVLHDTHTSYTMTVTNEGLQVRLVRAIRHEHSSREWWLRRGGLYEYKLIQNDEPELDIDFSSL
ncbi:hypothetical protein HOI18_02830 [Candidatus Uhrbacteria bacterium]|jgi:hypothetical protein|nr:hypothetical protein [Candidatus Uhrbacteria bacterium]